MTKDIEGGIPCPFEGQPPTGGEDNKANSMNPHPERWSSLAWDSVGDTNLHEDTGKDTYQGIPGDGVVPAY